MDIKELIKGEVTFQYFRGGIFWYQTENKWNFPVPLEDVGNATLLVKDKGILFMRYIRKHLEAIESK